MSNWLSLGISRNHQRSRTCPCGPLRNGDTAFSTWGCRVFHTSVIFLSMLARASCLGPKAIAFTLYRSTNVLLGNKPSDSAVRTGWTWTLALDFGLWTLDFRLRTVRSALHTTPAAVRSEAARWPRPPAPRPVRRPGPRDQQVLMQMPGETPQHRMRPALGVHRPARCPWKRRMANPNPPILDPLRLRPAAPLAVQSWMLDVRCWVWMFHGRSLRTED